MNKKILLIPVLALGLSFLFKMGFKTETVLTTDVSREQLWRIWADVNQWPTWDPALEEVRLIGNFEKGGQIYIKPKQGFDTTSLITECSPETEFTTSTPLPLWTTLKFKISFVQEGTTTKAVHMVSVESRGPGAVIFKFLILNKITADLKIAINNLVEKAKGLT